MFQNKSHENTSFFSHLFLCYIILNQMSEFICIHENCYAPGVDVFIDLNTNPFFIIPDCGCISGICFENPFCSRWSRNVECDVYCSNTYCCNRKIQSPKPFMKQIYVGETRYKGYCLFTDYPFILKGTVLGKFVIVNLIY